MDFSFEAFFIFLLFVLPGFLATYLWEASNPNFAEKKSPFELVIHSAINGFLIFVISGFFFGYLARNDDGVSRFIQSFIDGQTLTFLKDDFIGAFIYFAIWMLITFGITIWISKVSPIYRLSKSNRERSGANIWFYVLSVIPSRSGFKKVYVRVAVKDGPVYEGFIGSYEIGRAGEPRLFWLYDAIAFKRNRQGRLARSNQTIPFVLMKFNEKVDSIEILRWEEEEIGIAGGGREGNIKETVQPALWEQQQDPR